MHKYISGRGSRARHNEQSVTDHITLRACTAVKDIRKRLRRMRMIMMILANVVMIMKPIRWCLQTNDSKQN